MIVDCAIYEAGERRGGRVPFEEALHEVMRSDDGFVWIGLVEPTPDEFHEISEAFGLHPLAVEDAVHAHQRPKIEVYGDTVFVVLKAAKYVDSEEVIELSQIMVFLGEGFVVTVRHGEHGELHELRTRLEDRQDLLSCGPGAIVHAIADKVVDDYQVIAAAVEEDIEEVEQQMFSPERSNSAERIYNLKREVIEFRHAVLPLVEPMSRLASGAVPHVHERMQPFFRDVADHAVRVSEQVQGFDDLLTSVLNANLAQVSVQQNEDMRRISAWVAIAAVPTAIAGIYGMNFDHMPELRWELGYPGVLTLMA